MLLLKPSIISSPDLKPIYFSIGKIKNRNLRCHMSYYIKEISLNRSRYTNYQMYGKEENVMRNLSKINILIGTNNSGKSRMLRLLLSEKELLFTPANFDFKKLSEIFEDFRKALLSLLEKNGFDGFGNLQKEIIENIPSYRFIKDADNYLSDFQTLIKDAKEAQSATSYTSLGNQLMDQDAMQLCRKNFREIALEAEATLNNLVKEKKIEFKRVYIPTLRGLRGFENNGDYYLKRTKKDYFSEDENLEIFTGLNLYEEVKRLLLGNLEDRERIADFQKFIGKSFFEGQDIALIPNVDSDVLYVKIGNELERKIHDLGDGIQSLIILTFPLFKYKGDRLLLFIEEPELYLHPGMQRRFLEIITHQDFDGYQYFLTTHSNHFLDLTLDMEKMSIYSFSKELEEVDSRERNANFVIENVSNEDDNVLKMLGVRNSAVLLSNCTIWVEGITDRFYIRHFLNLYERYLDNTRTYKEDIHYSFVEYSGNNITHWSFLDDDEKDKESVFSSIKESRVCGSLFLITDKDSQRKETRQSKLSQALEERYYCLDCKEIENIITVDVLKKVISGYEKVEVTELAFSSNFSMRTYSDKYLGRFIENVLLDKRRRGSYSSASGAVSDKVGFCKRTIAQMESFDDLSEEAKKLSRTLYEFIAKNN